MLYFLTCLQQNDTCAGTLVNTDALQCKLINSHLDGLSLDVNNSVPGWSFYAVDDMAFLFLNADLKYFKRFFHN